MMALATVVMLLLVFHVAGEILGALARPFVEALSPGSTTEPVSATIVDTAVTFAPLTLSMVPIGVSLGTPTGHAQAALLAATGAMLTWYAWWTDLPLIYLPAVLTAAAAARAVGAVRRLRSRAPIPVEAVEAEV